MNKAKTETTIHIDLKKKFLTEVKPKLVALHPDLNVMEIPTLEKIVINMGLGQARDDRKAAEKHADELSMITGQKPRVTKAKKSISNFKLRENEEIGLMVTLRGARMYEFLDRFCNIAAPRIRDFRGFSRKCDGMGNYTFGLTDQQIFPEVDLNKITRQQGMNVTIVTTASKLNNTHHESIVAEKGTTKADSMCIELLTMLGFPFKNEDKPQKS